MKVLYEDNHIIIVSKSAGEIVQGDKTGDTPLSETVKLYIKEKYAKPGAVFLGVVHRLDRPVSGVVVFARTSKALTRLNELFRSGEVKKTYWALTQNIPKEPEGVLTHYLVRNEQKNKSFAYDHERPGAKKAVLDYSVLGHSDRYHLLEAAMGCPIRGDLKYGAPRSNPDGSISLHARSIRFVHPVSHEEIFVEAPLPTEGPWQAFTQLTSSTSEPA